MKALNDHLSEQHGSEFGLVVLISLAVALAGVGGVYWFVTGASLCRRAITELRAQRSRGGRRRWVASAMAKLPLGVGIAWCGEHAGPYQGLFAAVALWFLVTGLVRLVLLLR